MAVLAGVRVQAGREQPVGPAGQLFEGRVERPEKGQERVPADGRDRFAEGPVVAEQGDLEPVRPEGHDDPGVEPGQVIGVPHEGVTGQGPGRLGDRGGDQRVDAAGPGLGHGRFEGPEGDLAVLRGDAAGGGRSEGPGDGREIDPGSGRTVGRPGARPPTARPSRISSASMTRAGDEEDVGGRRQHGRPGQRLDGDLGADAARVAGGHPDPGDGHFPPEGSPSPSGDSAAL